MINMRNNIKTVWIGLLLLNGITVLHAQSKNDAHRQNKRPTTVILNNGTIELKWQLGNKGQYNLQSIELNQSGSIQQVADIDGSHKILFTDNKPPDSLSLSLLPPKLREKTAKIPESHYSQVLRPWKTNMSPVNLNIAGEEFRYKPTSIQSKTSTSLHLYHEAEGFTVSEQWNLDPNFKNDIQISITLRAKRTGYYSIASPSLFSIDSKDIQWGIVPGVLQGNFINDDFVRAYAYGHGIPNEPVVVRERTATTLSSMVTTKKGITIAATAEPGTGRNPWEKDKKTHNHWKLGLSLMTREKAIMPTLYHPVLGEADSYLHKGDSITFAFRYTIVHSDWYPVFKHVVNDVYRLPGFLELKEPKHSLTDRLYDMYTYLLDKRFSQWHTDTLDGTIIGAQRYLGVVYKSDRDAAKNADYGAMWMLAKLTNDRQLQNDILPLALNFKTKQQNETEGFFYGAVAGQYYLYKSKKFTEEWGPYTEPIGTTYYALMDMGNILLFEPGNEMLREKLRNAADRLLTWMKPNGQWEVAYENASQKPMFLDLADFRPTFYGLLVAYKILKDEKYLLAAQQGADWFIDNALASGRFIGVCGDTRFAPDFATAQSIEALLTLYEETREERYKEAALHTAQIFTTYIYTHPIPSRDEKQVRGQVRKDWEISQVGLNVEHGGTIGSANERGPILLTSHAGLFVRLYEMTNDSLYLTLARAAAWARDAFVDKASGVASYYWDSMNSGPGSFPHHAWWQIGWITDYLLSEVSLRSKGKIHFPAGFVTPKVGPHKSYGFEKGTLFGHPVELIMQKGLLKPDNPHIDYVMALDKELCELYVMLINNSVAAQHLRLDIQPEITLENKRLPVRQLSLMNATGVSEEKLDIVNISEITFDGSGLKILKIKY